MASLAAKIRWYFLIEDFLSNFVVLQKLRVPCLFSAAVYTVFRELLLV